MKEREGGREGKRVCTEGTGRKREWIYQRVGPTEIRWRLSMKDEVSAKCIRNYLEKGFAVRCVLGRELACKRFALFLKRPQREIECVCL